MISWSFLSLLNMLYLSTCLIGIYRERCKLNRDRPTLFWKIFINSWDRTSSFKIFINYSLIWNSFILARNTFKIWNQFFHQVIIFNHIDSSGFNSNFIFGSFIFLSLLWWSDRRLAFLYWLLDSSGDNFILFSFHFSLFKFS